jgi:hypothetical protein
MYNAPCQISAGGGMGVDARRLFDWDSCLNFSYLCLIFGVDLWLAA